MKKDKMLERNLELSLEFSRYLFEHPELEKKIPKGAHVALLPEFDPELRRFNLRLARRQQAKGEQVVYVKVPRLAPEKRSRLVGAEIERVG